MAAVLVTGGTGTLGRRVVPLLLSAGRTVRVLSRRSRPALPAGVEAFRGDVRTGAGIERAVEGCDAVIHAASNPRRRARDTEVAGARHVAAAAKGAGAHLLYVSIVGVDRHRFPYYRAKLAAEHVIAGSGADWTLLRATQFHDLIDDFLGMGWFPRTPNLRFQPVDAAEVARRLVDLALGPPQGRVPDFGGPEVLAVDELTAARRRIAGRRTRLIPVPAVGFLRDFDDGRHLAPQHPAGRCTWADWLADRR